MRIRLHAGLAIVAAIGGLAAVLTPSATAGSARGPGGVAKRVTVCAADGVKDTQVYVTNPSMGTVSFTAKVASAQGVGEPQTFVLQPMGVAFFDCNDFQALYPGGRNSFRRGVFMVQSDSDLRIASVLIAKFKNLPVANPEGAPLDPVGQ